MKVDMDESTIPAKPSNVTIAVNALYISFGIGLARGLLGWWFGGSSAKPMDWVILLILGPVFLWIYYMTGKGRHWARNIVLILALATVPLSLPLMIETLGNDASSMPLRIGLVFLDVAGLFLDLAALLFLFQRDSVDWFKAMNQPTCAIPIIERLDTDQVSYAVDYREAGHRPNDLSIRAAATEIVATLRELTVNKLRPRNMFRSLRNTDQPILSYVWRAWLIAFIPSLVVGAIAASYFALLGYKDPRPNFSSPSEFVIGAVLIAPWLETIMMWPVLGILKLIFRKTLLVALASGVIFGGLHVLGGPHLSQGVATTWSFLVLSLCFLEWQKKSTGRAITVTALVHTCHNGLVFALVLIAIVSGAENPLVKKEAAAAPGQKKQISAKTSAGARASSPRSSVSPGKVQGKAEPTDKEKRRTFERAFPGCRQEEFDLANDDLYPDWKKNHSPTGTWEEFLLVYKDFVQWWENRGSPAEPGFKLWKDYWAARSPA